MTWSGSHLDSVSICGKRPEMEDDVAVVPRFMKVPIKMFIGDHVIEGFESYNSAFFWCL